MEDLVKPFLIEENENKSLVCSDFRKIKKQAGLIKAMFGIRINGFVPYLELQKAIETAVYNRLKDHADEEIASLVSKKYASNTVTTIEWWMEHCEKYSEEFVYEIIYTCVYEGLFHLLKKK